MIATPHLETSPHLPDSLLLAKEMRSHNLRGRGGEALAVDAWIPQVMAFPNKGASSGPAPDENARERRYRE
jgi:hypothetical protein